MIKLFVNVLASASLGYEAHSLCGKEDGLGKGYPHSSSVVTRRTGRDLERE